VSATTQHIAPNLRAGTLRKGGCFIMQLAPCAAVQPSEDLSRITFGPKIRLGLNRNITQPTVKPFGGRWPSVQARRACSLCYPLPPLMGAPQIPNI
jgi:hypothetical protein